MSTAAVVVIMAMLLVTTIPSGAAGEGTIPYIEIQEPQDGATVGTKTTLVVVAEGEDLKNPTASISGGYIGIAFPLQGCVFEIPAFPEGEEVLNQTMKMYCKQELNLESFAEEKVKVSVSVQEASGVLTDSVGLYVSGHCAW